MLAVSLAGVVAACLTTTAYARTGDPDGAGVGDAWQEVPEDGWQEVSEEGWQEVPDDAWREIRNDGREGSVDVLPADPAGSIQDEESDGWQALTQGTERYRPAVGETGTGEALDPDADPDISPDVSASDGSAPDGSAPDAAERQAVAIDSEVREFGSEGSRAALGTPPSPADLTDSELFAPSIDSGALPPPSGAAEYRMPRRTPAPVDGSSTFDESDLDLFVGEVRVLGQVDVTRVAIGRGSIVDAQILANGELLLIAQGPGSTSLRLWNVDGSQSSFNIRISEEDPETRVRMERMVRMRVRLVEFRKSALGSLGIDWNADGIAGPTLAIAGDAVGNNLFRPQVQGFEGLPNRVEPFSTYFGIASNITSRINFLSSRGDAVTIAEPVLSAINGGAATFLAGGEVPYPSVDGEGNPIVDFKEYGIKLNIAPLIDRAGNVRAQVETEISQLDPSVTILDAPGLLTRRATTEVNVRTGETIVISGLLSAESSEDIDRIPGLGRLPVIGALFRSKNIRDSVSELVIFVTPEVIDPQDGQPRMTERERFAREDSNERLNAARDQLFLMD